MPVLPEYDMLLKYIQETDNVMQSHGTFDCQVVLPTLGVVVLTILFIV